MIIKKFIESILDELQVENINVVLDDENEKSLNANIFNNTILWSEINWLKMYCVFSSFLQDEGIDIEDNFKYYHMITKSCIAHEVGHLIDNKAKEDMEILKKIQQKSAKCLNEDEFKIYADCFKDILIGLEQRAWRLVESKMDFHSLKERIIFLKIKEFCLNTYYNTEYCRDVI